MYDKLLKDIKGIQTYLLTICFFPALRAFSLILLNYSMRNGGIIGIY